MKRLLSVLTCISIVFPMTGGVAYADEVKNKDQYVSREQYDQLKREMEELRKQVQFLMKKGGQKRQQAKTFKDKEQQNTASEIAQLKRTVDELKVNNEKQKDGTTGFLLTGYGFAGYNDSQRTNSSFNAGFNPIFLWRLREDLLFEAEIEFEFENNVTEVSLEFAQLSYLLNDYLTIGVGKFLNPSNFFMERLHPAWINKLPDRPITMIETNPLQANSQLGIQIRGGLPIGSTKGEYAFYVSNGPSINTDGTLSFKDVNDSNNSKAVGGRIGWFPFSGFEIGYGFETAGVTDPANGSNTLDVITHVIDLNYIKNSKLILGTIDIRGQYSNRKIDRSASFAFDNSSSGGYGQIAYRPSLVQQVYLKNIETVLRFDWIDLPNVVTFNDEQRWTIGINYYIAASTMFKFAYRFDNKQGALDDNALLFQVSSGF